MTSALKSVVKVEKDSSLNLRRIFSTCGTIRNVYASGFIEFGDAASVDRAVALQASLPRGTRVLRIDDNPQLVEQYRKVNPAFVFPKPRSNSENSPPSTGGFIGALKSTQKPVSSSHLRRQVSSKSRPSSTHAPPSAAPPVSAQKLSPNPMNHIPIRVCGETLTLDLCSLAGDAASVIQLLKLSSSDRGTWLIVAAYYRRIGNSEAAKEVATALLEALREFNVPDGDLKPVFLLLSGCETDLGKKEKLKDGDASGHYKNAEKWLQKVYGANMPLSATVSEQRARSPSADYRKLEREVESLRERKRKLEDMVGQERETRRRIEKELETMKRERW
ncbi:40S ribosomal protein [Mycena kentingensis (nom. inval.)]|nr:40S ribosomal protein [Mycena kentingensis (nom. inval.)]